MRTWVFLVWVSIELPLNPSAILDSTGETVVGATESVTFAIGTKAAWTASYYAGDDLLVGAVSGDESDSDMDGVELLLEYAFNLNPVSADFKILGVGNGTIGLPWLGWFLLARIQSCR